MIKKNIKYSIVTLLTPMLIQANSTAPANPSNLKLIPTKTTVKLTWNDNSNDETGFKIFRDKTLIYITQPNTTSFLDTKLKPNTTYHYTVVATNDSLTNNQYSFTKQISDANSDVEEQDDGSMYMNSSDLELTYDEASKQIVGLRFSQLNIPQNAIIKKAYIQFQTDEISTGETSLEIYAQDTANAPIFTEESNNLSSRILTSSSIQWNPPAWEIKDEHSKTQATPDLSSIIQEIINKTDWKKNNSIVFIIKGEGSRVAVSFEGNPSAAPKLYIEYKEGTLSADTTKPIISINGSNTINLKIGDIYNELGATATDNIDGDLTSSIIITPSDIDTSVAKTYTITYKVSDMSGNTAYATRTVIVSDTPPIDKKGVHINEVLTANTNINLDPDFYAFSDWIELYNYDDHSIDISGYYLSNDKDNNQLWKIPNDTTIPAHGYILIWADKEDKKENAIHTNFKLSQKKGTLILSDDNGNIIDSIDYSKQKSDISYTSINNHVVYMIPSPNKNNNIQYDSLTRVSNPTISLQGGFYNSSQTLTISSDANSEIYYTTDGSAPTPNSKKYTKPVTISKSTVIRARAYTNDKLYSEIVTQSYIINHKGDIPVVSLSTDSKYLFDDMIGIYTDGKNGIPLKVCGDEYTIPKNYAQDWARPVNLEYFDQNRSKVFEFGANIEITGQCSREQLKKSFSIKMKSKYGTKSITQKLYPTKDKMKIKDFKIKSGNHGYEISDILAAALTAKGKLDIDYQAYQPIQMYVNGDYWGVYTLREKKGSGFLISNYPTIDKKKLDIINIGAGDVVKEGDIKDFDALKEFLEEHDISQENNYQQLVSMVDEKNFIDYMILMIYSANTDWIDSNNRCWKEKKPDSKWRWMLDDLDAGFKKPDLNFFDLKDDSVDDILTVLFPALLSNSTFKQKFKTRFYELLDTLFDPKNVNSIIDEVAAAKKAYIGFPKEGELWDIFIEDLDEHLQILHNFANKRKDIVKKQLDNL